MNPSILAVIGFALEAVIKNAPGAIVAFRELFAKDSPTPEDWAALRAKLESQTYFDFVPDSKLPKP